jgi:hypothetical protein
MSADVIDNQAYALPFRAVGADVVIYGKARILAPRDCDRRFGHRRRFRAVEWR